MSPGVTACVCEQTRREKFLRALETAQRWWPYRRHPQVAPHAERLTGSVRETRSHPHRRRDRRIRAPAHALTRHERRPVYGALRSSTTASPPRPRPALPRANAAMSSSLSWLQSELSIACSNRRQPSPVKRDPSPNETKLDEVYRFLSTLIFTTTTEKMPCQRAATTHPNGTGAHPQP